MPSLLTFSPVPQIIFDDLKSLTVDFDRLAEHLGDTTFVSTDSTHFVRLFDGDMEPEHPYRQTKRLKAEVMLLQNGLAKVIHIDQALTIGQVNKGEMDGLVAPARQHSVGISPSLSLSSLTADETGESDDDAQAQTPPMGDSIHEQQGMVKDQVKGLGIDFGKMRMERSVGEDAF